MEMSEEGNPKRYKFYLILHREDGSHVSHNDQYIWAYSEEQAQQFAQGMADSFGRVAGYVTCSAVKEVDLYEGIMHDHS